MTRPNKEKAGNVTAGYFDSYANEFDSIYGSGKGLPHRLVNRYLRGSVRERFKLTLEACSPVEGKTVLDVGCGPGHYSVGLAMLGAKEVTGIDFARGWSNWPGQRRRKSICKKFASLRSGTFSASRAAAIIISS